MAESGRALGHDPRKTRVIRDPVHGYIILPDELTALTDHPYVQRLRRIAQTSMASAVLPSLTGTRFEHSLGTMHLARLAWNEIWSKLDNRDRDDFMAAIKRDLLAFAKKADLVQAGTIDPVTLEWIQGANYEKEFPEKLSLAIGAAGLLHDLGHTPYSHALEGFFERNIRFIARDPVDLRGLADDFDPSLLGLAFHELAGLSMMSRIDDSYLDGVPFFVSIRILGKGLDYTWERALYQIISSEVDVDRMDYLIRDASRAGSEFGAIDHERLIQSIELHPYRRDEPKAKQGWRVGFGYRARTAIETFLTNRLRYYQWVLFHPHVVAANKFLELSLQELVDIAKDTYSSTTLDKLLTKQIDECRPNLDYLGVDIQVTREFSSVSDEHEQIWTVTDQDSTILQAEVDDSSIQQWMRSSATLARSMPRVGMSPGLQASLRRFDALYMAAQFRAPNWQPAWKTEDRFRAVASTLQNVILEVFESTRDELNRSRNRLASSLDLSEERRREDAAAHSRSLVHLEVLREALEANPSNGINQLAQVLLHRHDATGRHLAEKRFANLLDEIAKLPREIKGGRWVVSFQKTIAAEEGENAVHIFNWAVPQKASAISLMVQHIPLIAVSHPQLFVFYVSETSTFERHNKYRTTIRDAFVEAFPIVVGQLLADSLEAQITRRGLGRPNG